MFVITNDIRYQETEYSITLGSFSIDWRFVLEVADEAINFNLITTPADSIINFGSILAA
jgi:hypothetical protein